MNKQWLVWLQVTIEEDTYKSKNTLTFNMFKLMLNMTFLSILRVLSVDLLFCEWLIPKCTQEEVLCFQAPLTSDTCCFFYCFSFLLSELLLMLLPLCFMFFLFFTIKSPICFFICFLNLCKRKKQSTYSFCFYSSLHSPSTISLPNRDSNGRLKFTVHWAES